MTKALIGLHDYAQIESTTWLIQFEVEIDDCAKATGDFAYRMVIKRPDSKIYTQNKKSEPYTPSEGNNFIFEIRENLPIDDILIGIDMIESLMCRCDDRTNREGEYLPEFNPYAACGKSDVIEPLWIAGAVALLYQLAVIYRVMKEGDGGDINKFLAAAVDALDKISEQISNIEERLDEITDLLKELPEKIRGVYETSRLRELLGEARGYSQLISDKTHPQNIETNLPELNQAVDGLLVSLNRIIGLKGIAGYMVISPYLGVWLVGAVAIQKIRIKTIPGYQPSSPWNLSLMKFANAGMLTLFEDLDKANEDYQTNWIPNFPKPSPSHVINEVHELGKKYFVSMRVQRVQPGMFKVECEFGQPINAKKDALYVAVQRMSGDIPVFGEINWKRLNQPNITSPDERRYYDVFMRLTRDRLEVKTFYPWAYPVTLSRQELLASFVEPKGLWG